MLRTPRTRTLPMWLWSASQQRKLQAATPPTARMRSVLRTRPLPGFRSTIACGSMAVREHGAADGVRGLWPAPEDINAVLSGERSPAKQQYGSPEAQHQQLSHRIFLLLSPDSEARL